MIMWDTYVTVVNCIVNKIAKHIFFVKIAIENCAAIMSLQQNFYKAKIFIYYL